MEKYQFKNAVACNKYLFILFILCFVIVLASCQSIFFPNTLAPAKTYNAGNGEAGIRSFNFAPPGGDFKIGITNNIQISGIISPFHFENETDILSNYEGSIQINPNPSEKNMNFHIISIGGGVFMGPANYWKESVGNYEGHGNSQTDYVYIGYYPGRKISSHVSVSFPLRIYEFIGHYQYISTTIFYRIPSHTTTSTTTSSLARFQGTAFVPEVDWSFDWKYVGFRFGINTPITCCENYNPITVVAAPAFSAGLYGKW